MCNNVQIYKASYFIKELEAMNISEYAFDPELSEMFFVDVSNDTSLREISKLKSFGLIDKKGVGRGVYYVIE